MIRLAWKNLRHDKLKLATAVAGVVFATVLMNLQVGMLAGFTDTITAIIARSPGDLWIMADGTKNFEMVMGTPERRHYQALATDGVAWSSRMIVDFTAWKTKAGQFEQVVLIGVDPEHPVGLPWAMAAGSTDALWADGGVICDQNERDRLGGAGLVEPATRSRSTATGRRSSASARACARSPRRPSSSPACAAPATTPTASTPASR
jgi:putative ABC transport system permease protein